MRTLIHASFYTFGGAAWTFLALHIQEHFFWPEDLTRTSNVDWIAPNGGSLSWEQ
jgi:hypothetical protein